MGIPLRMLLVEDSPQDAQLLVDELEREGYTVAFERVDTAEGMQRALAHGEWDIVVSDFHMPAFSAPDALALFQASGKDLPFIIVSGTVGEEAAVAALKAGANDFFVKGRLSRLAPAIQRELGDAAGRRERRATSLLGALEEISRLVVSHTGDPGETLTNIARLIQQRYQSDVCSVYLLEPDRVHLVMAATVGLDPSCVGRVRMQLNEGLVGLVGQQLEPQVVADATFHPRFKYFPEAGEDRYHSFLGVPMMDRGLLVGVMVVQTIEPREYSRNDVRMIATAASQLAPIVSDARIVHEAQLQAERLRVVQVTMRSVHDIVNNCLNQLQLLRIAAEGRVPEESLNIFDDAIQDAGAKLRALGDMEVFAEKPMEIGTGLDVDATKQEM